jgi:hypothetical protein
VCVLELQGERELLVTISVYGSPRDTAAPMARPTADGKTVRRDAHGKRSAECAPSRQRADGEHHAHEPAPGEVVKNPRAHVGYQLNFSPAQLEQLYRSHSAYQQQRHEADQQPGT